MLSNFQITVFSNSLLSSSLISSFLALPCSLASRASGSPMHISIANSGDNKRTWFTLSNSLESSVTNCHLWGGVSHTPFCSRWQIHCHCKLSRISWENQQFLECSRWKSRKNHVITGHYRFLRSQVTRSVFRSSSIGRHEQRQYPKRQNPTIWHLRKLFFVLKSVFGIWKFWMGILVRKLTQQHGIKYLL